MFVVAFGVFTFGDDGSSCREKRKVCVVGWNCVPHVDEAFVVV